MVSFLPDTNVLIYAFKGINPYAAWLEKIIKEDSLQISVITVAEFLEGATKDNEISLKILLDRFGALPIDRMVAEIGAGYKRGYSKKTKKIWISDCLIAATCKVYGLTLVTADKKDFPMKDIEVITKL